VLNFSAEWRGFDAAFTELLCLLVVFRMQLTRVRVVPRSSSETEVESGELQLLEQQVHEISAPGVTVN